MQRKTLHLHSSWPKGTWTPVQLLACLHDNCLRAKLQRPFATSLAGTVGIPTLKALDQMQAEPLHVMPFCSKHRFVSVNDNAHPWATITSSTVSVDVEGNPFSKWSRTCRALSGWPWNVNSRRNTYLKAPPPGAPSARWIGLFSRAEPLALCQSTLLSSAKSINKIFVSVSFVGSELLEHLDVPGS